MPYLLFDFILFVFCMQALAEATAAKKRIQALEQRLQEIASVTQSAGTRS